LKAVQFASIKTEPSAYYYLGQAILKGEYDPLEAEYGKFAGKDETPESQSDVLKS